MAGQTTLSSTCGTKTGCRPRLSVPTVGRWPHRSESNGVRLSRRQSDVAHAHMAWATTLWRRFISSCKLDLLFSEHAYTIGAVAVQDFCAAWSGSHDSVAVQIAVRHRLQPL